MVETHGNAHRNRLLALLGPERLGRLWPDLELVDLPLATLLESPDKPIAHVWFPTAGVGSVVVGGEGRERAEARLFGREGMSGLAMVLGGDRSPHETRMQVAGQGYRVAAEALREAMRADDGIRELFLRYALAGAAQGASTILANARFGIEERLARWLLMCHDRMDGDVLETTHEFLAIMLGVRRAGVTVAVHMLEGRGVLQASRGRIRISDRAGLEGVAEGIYGPAEAEDARLLGEWRTRRPAARRGLGASQTPIPG